MYIDLDNISDFDILAQIYEDTVIKNELAHFSKLVKETGIDWKIVSKNLDILDENLCMIEGKMTRAEDKKYRLCYKITDEAMFIAKARYEYNQQRGEELANANVLTHTKR